MQQELIDQFVAAAQALDREAVPVGATSNGLKIINFTIDGKIYSAIEQNPNKLSRPGLLAREGHKIVQIRDFAAAVLVGNVDITDRKFTPYNTTTDNVLDINEINEALGLPPTKATTASAVPSAPVTTVPQTASTSWLKDGQSGPKLASKRPVRRARQPRSRAA